MTAAEEIRASLLGSSATSKGAGATSASVGSTIHGEEGMPVCSGRSDAGADTMGGFDTRAGGETGDQRGSSAFETGSGGGTDASGGSGGGCETAGGKGGGMETPGGAQLGAEIKAAEKGSSTVAS